MFEVAANRRTKPAFLLSLLLVAACTSQPSPSAPPRPETIKTFIEKSYARPELHQVTARPNKAADIVTWQRTYDGVEMLDSAKSVAFNGGAWEHRFHRELAEPEPVRRSEVLSFAAAATSVGLDDGLRDGTVTARLVYRPELALQDGEIVVKRQGLAIALSGTDATTYVDAYSGERIARDATAQQSNLTVTTQNYGPVGVDVTQSGGTYWWRDPIRSSWQDCSTSPCTQVNGTGLYNTTAYNVQRPLPPFEVSSSADTAYFPDLFFSLEQSWDYYQATFNRRGLANLSASSAWTANDATMIFTPLGANADNMLMTAQTGVIQVDRGAPDWTSMAVLDMVGHEWSHGVFYWETGGPAGPATDSNKSWGATGGISEANSDLFGELIEARSLFLLGRQVDPAIEDGWVYAAGRPLHARYMCTPQLNPDGTYPAQWQQSFDDPAVDLEPHLASGPFSRAFCLLGRGMVPNGSNNFPELQSPLVPNGFAGFGSALVGTLEYRTLHYLGGSLSPVTGPQIRQAMLTAVTSLGPLGGTDSDLYKAVEDAFAVIGIGAPADRTPPVITLVSSSIGAGTPIAVNATDDSGVAAVTFSLGGTWLGTLTAPPWQVSPGAFQGTQWLTVTATDIHGNSTTASFIIEIDTTGPTVAVVDITPCENGTAYCGGYQHHRTYRVTATDESPIGSVHLSGPDGDHASLTSPAIFDVAFTTDGFNVMKPWACDTLGNCTKNQIYNIFASYIDLAGPTFTSGPTYSQNATIEGRVYLDYCLSDYSYLHGGQVWGLTIDGAYKACNANPPTQENSTGTSACYRTMCDGVTVGSHNYFLGVSDKWSNSSSLTRTFVTTPLPPTVQTPIATPDLTTLGHEIITAKYSATHGIAEVDLSICQSTCSLYPPFFPSNSAIDQSTHNFDVTGLANNTPYTAIVKVTGQNGATTTKQVTFTTIASTTPPNDVVFNEIEPNDYWFTSNIVSSGYNVIRGAQAVGVTDDFFAIQVPAGQEVCVAGAKTNGAVSEALFTLGERSYWSGSAPSLPWGTVDLEPSRSHITSADYVCGYPDAGDNYVIAWVWSGYIPEPEVVSYDLLFRYQPRSPTPPSSTQPSVASTYGTYAPGQAVQVSFHNFDGVNNWLNLVPRGAPMSTLGQKLYSDCAAGAASVANGTCSYAAGVSVTGVYVIRAFLDDSWTEVAESPPFTVAGPAIGMNAASVLQGAPIPASWSGLSNASDWIALAPQGAALTTIAQWNYVNCTRAPTTAITSGSCKFAGGLSPGTYVARAFFANQYTLAAESVPFTVVAPLPPPTNLSVYGAPYQATLSWDPVPGATGYVIKRGTASGFYTTIISLGSATSFVDTGLGLGLTYYYVLSATNAVGAGLFSPEVSVRIPIPRKGR